MRAHPILLAAGLVALLSGCDKGNQAPAPAASASAMEAGAPAPSEAFGVPIGVPYPADKIVAAVNPGHKPPYAGPKGTLKGMVRIDGDPPPDTGLKFPDKCRESTATYGKLFRVGLDKALADAMVLVAGYEDRAFVPASDEASKITIHHCVLPKRTYAVTYGQRLEVSNLDQLDSYLPYIDGTPTRTMMVAIPQGSPVKLYPGGPGPAEFMIRDQMASGLVANLFVVNYSTHDVTGLDGQYEIKGIPAGKVRVNVFLPVIGKLEAREVEVKEGDNTLDFTLHFDASKDIPKTAPPASASASAAPKGSASASAPPKKLR